MLPEFPKLKSEIHSQLLARIRRRIEAADPVVSQIKAFTQHEGQRMRYERLDAPSAEINESEDVGAPFQVLVSEVPDLIGANLDAKIEALAQDVAKNRSAFFFRRFQETCDEVGNAVHAGGKPLSAELLLEMLDKVQVDFGPDGKPTGQFVIHPDMAPALKKAAEELERDPELKRRHEDILRRQREEWAARESNRKLVD